MTNREVVAELRKKGFKVTFRARKDGSIRIKSIEGVKFSGSEGNNRARKIIGQELSERKKQQRLDNLEKAERGKVLKKKYKTKKLTKPQKRALNKINRKIKKYGGKGRIGATSGKKIIKEKGLKGLKEKGKELIRKALGLVAPTRVDGEASAILDLGGTQTYIVADKLLKARYYMIEEFFNEIQRLRYEVKQKGIELIMANGIGYDLENDSEYTSLRELNLNMIDGLIELSVQRAKNLDK